MVDSRDMVAWADVFPASPVSGRNCDVITRYQTCEGLHFLHSDPFLSPESPRAFGTDGT